MTTLGEWLRIARALTIARAGGSESAYRSMRNATSRRSGSVALDHVDAGKVQRAGVQRRRAASRGRRPRAVERRDAGRLASPALAVIIVVDRAVKSSHNLAVHLSVGQYLRSRALGTDSVAGLHSMGKVSSQC